MSHASKVLAHRALRRRHLFGFALLALLIVWGVLWGLAYVSLNRTLDQIIAQATAKGITISAAKRYTNGTPFSIHTHLEPFSLTLKNGNAIHAKESVFYLPLWNWKDISGKLRNGISAKIMGVPLTAGIIRFGFELPARPPKDYTQTGLAVWLRPLGVTFEGHQNFVLGNRLEEGDFRLRIMGPVPDFMNPQSIAAWNNASGLIEFDTFNLNWGPLSVAANGSVGLDQNLQPEGAFSGRVIGLDDALSELAAQGKIKEQQIALLHATMNVLSRPSSLTGDSAPVVPLSLQGGSAYLGPVKLFDLPKVSWE